MTTAAPWVDDYNRNAVWCRLLVAQLAHHGVRRAVVSPGGRCAALALQLWNDDRFDVTPLTDERVGGFVALGAGLVTGAPAAMCTTSGSAVANVVPALVEAIATSTPMVLITCDRPHSHRSAGAWQTTDQVSMCAPFVRASVDLADPSDDAGAVLQMQERVAAALRAATTPGLRGPVHINVPLEGELDTTALTPGWTAPGPAPVPAPLPRPVTPPATPRADVERWAASRRLGPGLRGLVLAGPGTGTPTGELVARTGYPVLADAPSMLRRPAQSDVVAEGDALVHHPHLRDHPPEVVIRLGSAPVSHTVHAFLADQPCPQIRVAGPGVTTDVLGADVLHITEASLEGLAGRLATGDPLWLSWWRAAATAARTALDKGVGRLPWGEIGAMHVACHAGGFDLLHLANSMPVRHANLLLASSARTQRVFANRGVNGIDGTISTFLGELWGSGQRGLLVVGDQAALHDLGALSVAGRPGLTGCIVVINNGGGAIFDLLDCSRLPGYDEVMRTPGRVDLAAACDAFAVPYRRCDTEVALRSVLEEASVADGVLLAEVVVPARSTGAELEALVRRMVLGASRASLSPGPP